MPIASEYQLSYIIATRNRLPFLRITLQKLLENILPFEEIVVVDGGSEDGTKEYLKELHDNGKIHQFISEKDRNQAHGWNKAMLMAKGEILKKIIDDDVFCYSAVQKCKDYMLANSNVDIVISNDLNSSIVNSARIERASRIFQFTRWTENQLKSFSFGDVHMLIRRNSLSFLGLYNTSFIMMDWEYSLRISYLKANIAYYTGYNALSVYHGETISASREQKKIQTQGKKGEFFYDYKGDAAEISLWSKIKIQIGTFLQRDTKTRYKENRVYDLLNIYNEFYTSINKVNDKGDFEFLNSKELAND